MRVLVLLTLAVALAPAAWAQQKTGAVYLFADGAPADLTADMTEVLISNLAEGSELTILPKEKFLQRTQQVSDRYADQCLREADCVLKVGTGLNLSLVAVGFLQMQGNGYRLKATRYSLTGGDDQPFLYDGLADVPKLIGAVKDLATHLRESEGAVLALTGDNPGATVFIDDKFIGVLPLKAISVSEGFHKLLVRKKGFDDFRSKVSCKTGTRCEVPVELKPLAAGTATVVLEPSPEDVTAATDASTAPGRGVNPWRIVSGVGMGLGGAALGTGIYFLLRAKADSSYLDDNCSKGSDARTYCAYPARVRDEKVDDGKQSTTLSTALLVGGGVLLAGSTTLLILLWNHGDAPATAPAATLVPTVLPGYAGVSAAFAF